MVNEYLTRAYDTKVIFRELLCFYAPFGWVPVKENRAPNPNAPVHKMYDGNTVWSMEKQDYVSDYDVGRKRSEKIVVKRSTKYTRNNRLMTEEALMEYHLRWRYWLYPRCNRLRLINRCRPFWGSLWALCFIIFLFLHLVVAFGSPAATSAEMQYDDTAVIKVEAGDVYALDRIAGPYFMVDDEGELLTNTHKDKPYENKYYAVVDADTLYERYGVLYADKSIVFAKDAAGEDLEYAEGKTISVYKINTGFFGMVYKMLLEKPVEWFAEKGMGGLFNMLCYILAAFNFLMLLYQIPSNWRLKKNTERIIDCCVNAKAIVKAMQYEDITLMNGRQRQRYYQGQVINEAARNTGDPLYFGS